MHSDQLRTHSHTIQFIYTRVICLTSLLPRAACRIMPVVKQHLHARAPHTEIKTLQLRRCKRSIAGAARAHHDPFRLDNKEHIAVVYSNLL